MKKKQDASRRERTAAVGLVVCFVAMIATVGMVTFNQKERKTEIEEQQQLVEAENTGEQDAELTQKANTDTVQAEINTPIAEAPQMENNQASKELVFSATDVLIWPVDGNVLLSYSMDKTVYFSTLDQYKYNPALVIGGEVGDEVHASVIGEVTSIESTAQTGMTVTMNLGSGYEAVYGQLKDVCVEKGQRVSQGDIIGYISEPTKYYNVEGPNLYFQLLKDGEPVNPLEYLEA